MEKKQSVMECKRKLFNLGIKYGIAPRLISERLLSKEDKQDMLNGLVPADALETAVRCWMAAGMPDNANGLDDPYKTSKIF